MRNISSELQFFDFIIFRIGDPYLTFVGLTDKYKSDMGFFNNMEIEELDLESWVEIQTNPNEAIMATNNEVNRRFKGNRQIPNWVDKNNFFRY